MPPKTVKPKKRYPDKPEPDPNRFPRPLAFRIENLFKDLVAEGNPTAERIHQVACIISKMRSRRMEVCERCFRLLMARERYRACKYCGFKGNWKGAEAERLTRQSINESVKKHGDPNFKARDPRDYDR